MTPLKTSLPCVVLTSIRRPTSQVAAFLRQSGWRTVFVADLKTPDFTSPPGLEYLSVDWQKSESDSMSLELPWRHYARKNVGYLHAIRSGAEMIFDTDDDNAPIDPWTPRPKSGYSVAAIGSNKWVNVYAHFGGDRVWPRGFPLEKIGDCAAPKTESTDDGDVMVWQGLVEGDPDVDAIFRLTRPGRVEFQTAAPIILPAGSYCPFNSQNTWWSRPAFAYLYLPATVTFRFTDILRGLVAQRCFWAHGWRMGFQRVTARQERNAHDLLADFADEMPCYLLPQRIVERLDALVLGDDPVFNLRTCYEALCENGWVKPEELNLVDRWLSALVRNAQLFRDYEDMEAEPAA